MQMGGVEGQARQWLRVSAQVLMEEHEQLQPRILEIYKNNPELCSYATELAQLRMTGPDMESSLLQVLGARTVEGLDLIVKKVALHHPAVRAFLFFADLVRRDLDRLQTTH